MEATKEGTGLLDNILPPRLEDAGLEDCALPPDSIKEAFLKAASAVKSRASTLFQDDDDDPARCVDDPWPVAAKDDSDTVVGVPPVPEAPGPCGVVKGGGVVEDGVDKVVVVGGGEEKEGGDEVVVVGGGGGDDEAEVAKGRGGCVEVNKLSVVVVNDIACYDNIGYFLNVDSLSSTKLLGHILELIDESMSLWLFFKRSALVYVRQGSYESCINAGIWLRSYKSVFPLPWTMVVLCGIHKSQSWYKDVDWNSDAVNLSRESWTIKGKRNYGVLGTRRMFLPEDIWEYLDNWVLNADFHWSLIKMLKELPSMKGRPGFSSACNVYE
ncbi:hypothetical protein JRO89_XS09G0166600 [Xanthoceras sorbifolium]|uniref:Uncharacterized protein n=1 Tax=Xanthoceras sorbifolium TaxID=99658 RepID=A0ABQ8HLI2_9ROSI|nr:hypothetical protein JRO89_XS09G0166600 [Xanthoceras sorbifolium]